MIPFIVDRISPNDLIILLNAIYFKEDWFEPFKKELTKVHPFTNLNRTVSDVEMMYSKGDMYFENEEALAFSKPYKERFSFIGILPKKEGDFNLNDLNIEDLMRKRSYGSTFIGIPKFEIEDNIKIVEILKSLGLNTCFTANADFSKLFENEASNISNVIQKTAIKVNEKGTEASAVTSIGMRKSCIRFEEPKEIILNRSFAFMIYDEEWDVPLFIGKIINL